MARRLTNWIDSYMELTRETEPHPRYHLWVAITLIAASLGRKCSLKLGPEELFPNFYTILVGPPANKKSTAIRYGQQILEDAGTVKVAPAGRVTDQQLYIEMADAIRTEIMPDGTPFIHHTLMVIASELVLFLGESKGGGSRTENRMADICELYDGGRFSNRTKNQGSDFIVNPGLYILGATTPSWITTSMPMLAIGGGPTSRMVFVYADTKGKHISLTQMKPFDTKLYDDLVNDLVDIGSIIGEFEMSPDARATYEEWYYQVYPSIDLQDQRLESYIGRLPIIIVKTSMVLSAARSSNKIVEEDDLLKAIHILNNVNKYVGKSFGLLGYNQLGAQTALVRNLLEQRNILTRQEILTTLRMHINLFDYERIINSLVAEGFCKTTFCNGTWTVEKL